MRAYKIDPEDSTKILPENESEIAYLKLSYAVRTGKLFPDGMDVVCQMKDAKGADLMLTLLNGIAAIPDESKE